MNRESADPSKFVTLEIAVPLDSVEGMSALRGLVTALGWPARQRATLPGDLEAPSLPDAWRISDEQLLETSEHLWGSNVYGRSTIDWLKRERGYSSNRGTIWADGTANVGAAYGLNGAEIDGYPFCSLYVKSIDGKFGGDNSNLDAFRQRRHRLSDEVLLKRAQILWDLARPPFELATEIRDDLGWVKSVSLIAGDITRERLADYVRSRQYDKHAFHGTIGKMMDTMAVTAGTVAGDVIGDRDFTGEFVAAQELDGMMRDTGLNSRATNDIKNRLARAILAQLTSGRPFKHGEIILEGRSDGWAYEQIAASSLAALASDYKGKKETPTTRFLRQFA